MDILYEAKRVFEIEIRAMEITREQLGEKFEIILDKVVKCKGKVIMVGMGKSGHIARKIAATFSSLGTSSFYLNPAEAMHGDLGMISKQDIVIMLSHSGESNEMIQILPVIKLIGAEIVAITGNEDSTLAKHANVVETMPHFQEACHLGLAPTSSTTAMLCYGDALAVVASQTYGFKDVDFAKYHPAGALGKRIIYKVDDLMSRGENNAVVGLNAHLKEAIMMLTTKKLGLVTVIDDKGEIAGVITTGDLGRQLEKGVDVYKLNVKDIMTVTPVTVSQGSLAVEALNIMKRYNIYSLPVMKDKKPIGTISMQMIIGIGIVGDFK